MFLIYAIITLLMVAILLSYVQHKRIMRIIHNVSGPMVWPFLGNAQDVMGRDVDLFKVLDNRVKQFGDRWRAFVGYKLVLFLADPKDVQVLLNNNGQDFEKANEYEYLCPWLGLGIFTSGGEKWRKSRRVIVPAFHNTVLENFVQVFNDQMGNLLKKLRSHSENESFDVYPVLKMYALDVICETAMGTSINAQENPQSEYVNAVKEQCKLIMDRVKNPFKRPDILYKFSADFQRQKRCLSILHGFTHKIIKERKEILHNNNETMSTYIDETGNKRKMAFLDLLLLTRVEGQPLEDESIHEEVATFLFGGHDTITSALSFALYLLSRHSDVQSKVLKEQKEIFGDNTATPCTYSDLQKMKYTDMVLKESLRLYPPGPVLARKNEKEIKINDMTVPADTTIAIMVYHLNRNPKVHEDPDSFIPERWTQEDLSRRTPFASLAFGAGARNCIGQKFAMLEMKTNISMIIRNFELLPGDAEVDLKTDLILKSSTGVQIRVRDRN